MKGRALGLEARAGFTLVEVLIGSLVATMVMAGAVTTFSLHQRIWRKAEIRMEADYDANAAMHRVVYGTGEQRGLRAATADTIAVATNANGWALSYVIGTGQTNSVVFRRTQGDLLFLPVNRAEGRNIADFDIVLGTNTLGHVKSALCILRVDRQRGIFRASRTVTTEVQFRN